MHGRSRMTVDPRVFDRRRAGTEQSWVFTDQADTACTKQAPRECREVFDVLAAESYYK